MTTQQQRNQSYHSSFSSQDHSAMTTLLLLPGLDGTGLVFEPLVTHLPAEIETQLVRYPADRLMSLQEHVAFAKKQCPKKKPFVLLAESFSGPIALQLLADPPENLIGVIFVATFAHYPSPFLLDAGRMLPQGLLLKLFTTTLFSRFFCLGKASADAVKLFRKALKSVQLNVLSQRLKILAELPPPPEITFSGPCLYIQASNDRLVSSRAVAPLQRHLPQLQVEKIHGPHIILLAEAQRGARLISDFIASLTNHRKQASS
jgi:pimeloyl-ACP methyl ester carboxylesterase